MLKFVLVLILIIVGGDYCYRGNAGVALKLQAVKSVCRASKKLKSVFTFVKDKLEKADRNFYEVKLLQKLLRLKLLTEWTKGEKCGTMRVFLTNIRAKERNMRRELSALWKMGRRVVGEAGIAAGRLDEMVNVFAQSYGNESETKTCIGGTNGSPMEVLKRCYANNSKTGEWEFLTITEGGELFDNEFETNLETTLHVMLSLGNRADPWYDYGKDMGCQLTKGAPGGGYMKSHNLTENIIWGDGILGVSKNGNGTTGSKGNTRGGKYAHDVVWEAEPTKNNPTLRRVIKDFSAFEELFAKVKSSHKLLIDAFLQEKLFAEEFEALAVRTKKKRVIIGGSTSTKNKQNNALGGSGAGDDNEVSMEEWLSQVDGGIVEERLLAEEMKECT
ncbi:procyclin-associated 2 (PAG2) protein [Trypanosoma brucei equiperdum]|uniref:Procyclin-associated 2 (PAG2) protein n=1 Tax=Trypanosoma brucei equiperdum TaxID=630700 RepID=A0A3L6L539_9TRYP|nr:procyclin-associated 2 (PAG2) protein [Trypanosoma brucei equiperdum]